MTDRSAVGVPPTFPGAPWLATHQATVDNALAGSGLERSVVSRGGRFYNDDHWPALNFLKLLLAWARKNPRAVLTYKQIEGWVEEVNRVPAGLQPRIVIARTPTRLTPRLALALVGGGYHEAWHTLFTRRRSLGARPLWGILQPRWSQLGDWSCHVGLLQAMCEIIEDIRIERCGLDRFPAARHSVVALQDFVHAQEESARLIAQAQGVEEADCFTPFGVLTGTFRDVGLGYNTAPARRIMALRKHYYPEVMWLVRDVLGSHLKECQELGEKDDLGFLRKAMDVVIALQGQIDDEPEGEQEQGEGLGETAETVLHSAREDLSGLKGISEALGQAFLQANRGEEDLQEGEEPWCPFDTSFDVAEFVTSRDRAADMSTVNRWLSEVKKPIAFLRARFRSLMRALVMTDEEHGLRRGPRLSERMLPDTYIDLLDDCEPQRAYADEDEEIDTSTAAVVSRDQSSSTSEIKEQLDKCMLAVTEPIENVGGQVMVFGWRNVDKMEAPEGDDPYLRQYHRVHGIRYDVFKAFGERFANVKWRFARTRSKGGTPMADGIEYGLMALRERSEAYRILFVITDGRPPKSLLPVIRNQLRRAKAAGIHVIGVGCGEKGLRKATLGNPNPLPYIADVFEDWVYERDVEDLPVLLVRKLTEIFAQSERMRRA